MKSLSATIQIKSMKECFTGKKLIIMLYKVALTFESVDEILKCDHSNESHWAVLSFGIVYYAVQYKMVLSSESANKNPYSNESYWAVLAVILFTDRL